MGDACQGRADYFAYYGAVLLTIAHPQEAAVALEKALMLAPELGGAQLDYAQALAELGEIESARHLADVVATRADLPPGLQTWLIDQAAQWRDDRWRFGWSLDVLAGVESNLNSSPDIRYLTLVLPSGRVPLELDDREGRISGPAVRSDLIVTAARKLGSGLLQFGAESLIRHTPSSDSTRHELINANTSYLHPLWTGQLGLRVEQTRIRIGSAPAYLGNSLNLLYQLPPAWLPERCTLSAGQAYEQREFPAAPYQNGRYDGNVVQYGCRRAEWQFSAGLQSGRDHAQNASRLGGDQQRVDVNLGVSRLWGRDLVAFILSSSQARDQRGYSPLLGGERRRIDRLTARLSWEHPLDRRWSIIGQLEHTQQNSNIELFGMRNQTFYLGIRLRGG